MGWRKEGQSRAGHQTGQQAWAACLHVSNLPKPSICRRAASARAASWESGSNRPSGSTLLASQVGWAGQQQAQRGQLAVRQHCHAIPVNRACLRFTARVVL